MGEVHKLKSAIMVPIHPTKWEAVALRHLNNHNAEIREISREILRTSASPYIREQAGPVMPEPTLRETIVFGVGLSALLLLVSVLFAMAAWYLVQ